MARPRVVTPETLEGIAGLEGMAFEAMRGGASRQVCAILRKAIVDIDLEPGAALTEADVAGRFGISRTPVREAFRKLLGEGLLEIAPQKGSFVAKLRRSTLQDALFVREALECAAAQRACRAPVEARRTLLHIVERQREAIRHKDVEASLHADEDLHRAIMTLSGHASAWEVVRQARTHLDRLRRIASRELKGSKEALGHHERIAAAIVAGDEAAVAGLLRHHIVQIEGFIDRVAEIHPDYIE